jgi:CRP-like cAMP-binding protein
MSIMGEEAGTVSASVVADTKVFLYAIDRGFISKLFEKEPGLCMRFYFVVAQKLAKLLVTVSNKNSKEPEVNKEEKVNETPEKTEKVDLLKGSTEDDTTLSSRFGVDEIVVRAYNVTVRRGVPVYGRLYLSQRHLCFYGKNLGITQSVGCLLKQSLMIRSKSFL